MNAAAVQRLGSYFQRMGEVLGNESRRGSFALYAMGLLGDAERKSVEPIAARACPDPQKVDAMHQRLSAPGRSPPAPVPPGGPCVCRQWSRGS